jgi:hypothetical protein
MSTTDDSQALINNFEKSIIIASLLSLPPHTKIGIKISPTIPFLFLISLLQSLCAAFTVLVSVFF